MCRNNVATSLTFQQAIFIRYDTFLLLLLVPNATRDKYEYAER